MKLKVNGQMKDVPAPWQADSLLQVLREALGLVGAKYGCGAGLCGACTVLLEGQAVRSCQIPAAQAVGKDIQTIEGLAPAGRLHPVQRLWLDAAIPQCGYCQAGQIMSTVALLQRTPRPSGEDIDEALAGHLCRCGTQARMRAAIQTLSEGTA